MKSLLIISFLLLLGGYGFGQSKVFGEYYNNFGDNIVLNSDSTFYHTYRYDLVGSWSKGFWTTHNDTVLLTMTTIYDTIDYGYKKEAIISYNETSETFLPELKPFTGDLLYKQVLPCSKLFYKKEKLFLIDKNGKLITKKAKSIDGRKKLESYYKKLK